ncbi:MAG: hypothetical protein GEU98_17245 [Pseudonocardiaceae bacterium]|nr:hypothetical protein [Pseudonocardiaceae bacterium]
MADPSRHTGTAHNTEHTLPPRMPRWVKVAAIVAGLLILVFVVLKLSGIGGEHGPGRHLSAGDTASATVMGQYAAAGQDVHGLDGSLRAA